MQPVSAVQIRSSAAQTMQWLLDTATVEEIVAFLTTRPIPAATASELVGYRDVLWQRRCIFSANSAQLDIVGTGGVPFPRYNTSSTVAIVLAAMGIQVAKHGNRGSRQANGAFDFLEAIGLNLDALTHNAELLLHDQNLAFLFARDWHPGFGKIAQARSQVPFPTAFNLLGPLLNPASPASQIVGTGNLAIAQMLAEALWLLEKQGVVVCGRDGLDEVSSTSETDVFWVTASGIRTEVLSPEDFGLVRSTTPPLGGTAQDNAATFRALLEGQASPTQELVCLNAAFALTTLSPLNRVEALEKVRFALTSGEVERFFARYSTLAAANKVDF